jgi:hypothetical protein
MSRNFGQRALFGMDQVPRMSFDNMRPAVAIPADFPYNLFLYTVDFPITSAPSGELAHHDHPGNTPAFA